MYFVFIVMPLLSVIKVTMQGKYSQKHIKTFSDVLLYNTIVFLFSAFILAAIFLRQLPPLEVWIYALISATGAFLSQTFYTLAFKNGPITPTAIINSFNIIFTLFAGLIYFNEQWTIFTIVGFAFMSVAFCLIPGKNNDKKANLKWLILTAITFVCFGLSSVVMLLFSRSEFSKWQSAYTVLIFSIASVFSFIFTLFNVKVRKEPITIKRNWNLPLVALIIGGALGLYNLVNVIAYQHFPSYLVTPIISGACIGLTMIVNSIINREKPTIKMLIGVACAVVAIVLLNL